jgi:DNA-binding protein
MNSENKNKGKSNTFPRNVNGLKYYPNVIKISYETKVKSAINYVLEILEHRENVLICGLSLAISKVILIAEIVKNKIGNLHQINNIDCLNIKDQNDTLKIKRVPKLDILLSKSEPENKGLGYQPPADENIQIGAWKIKNINEDVSKLMPIQTGRRVVIVGHIRKGPRWRLRK